MDDRVDQSLTPGFAEAESGLILSGAGNFVFEDVFDWIWDAASSVINDVVEYVARAWISINRTVTDWVSWAVDEMVSWLRMVDVWIDRARDWIVDEVSDLVSDVWSWIVDQGTRVINAVVGWIRDLSSDIASWFRDIRDDIVNYLLTTINSLMSALGSLGDQLAAGLDWISTEVLGKIAAAIDAGWTVFVDRILDFPSWIGKLFDAAEAWVTRDVPGSSPWWHKPLIALLDFAWGEGAYTVTGKFEDFWLGFMTPFMAVIRPIGDLFGTVFDTFMDTVEKYVAQLGPMSPGVAASNFSSFSRVALTAILGLVGMTIAGEFLNPISHLGLGHVAAMIYDMTNYKVITGAFMGALAATMLRTPLNYYFNNLFRPWILAQRDFVELMSRGAFREPEILQTPELQTSVAEITGGDGVAYEQAMIGYYGYPQAYYGLFRELAYTRLGYFALAGIARTGFYNEAWFREALARTGYSATARTQLLNMYRRQATAALQSPVLTQVRKLTNEGFITLDEAKAYLARSAAMTSTDEAQILAVELEQVYYKKSTILDIQLRAFSRGLITEAACRGGLETIITDGELINLHLTMEKLGLIRKVSLPEPETTTTYEYIEE